MMHMICWRGLSSNHRGLAVLTREYLNPPPPHPLLPPAVDPSDVSGQTVKKVLGRILKHFQEEREGSLLINNICDVLILKKRTCSFSKNKRQKEFNAIICLLRIVNTPKMSPLSHLF